MKPSFLVFLAFLVGCSSHVIERAPLENIQKRAVIFIPGYYGTALKDAKTGDRLHLTFSKAMFGGPALALQHEKLSIPDSVTAKPDGVLSKLTIFPGIYSIDIYGESFEFLQSATSFPVIPFSYDWRESNVESSQKLASLVKRLRKAGVEKIALVAHSNGGLVAAYYLRYGDQGLDKIKDNWEGLNEIDAVVIAGTPFRGSVSSFVNMQNGVSFGLSGRPLNSFAMASFPSAYQLLPASELNAFINAERKPLSSEISAPNLWEEHQWGLFKDKAAIPEGAIAERRSYLRENLKLSKRYSEAILKPVERRPTISRPALFIVGKGRSTRARVQWGAKTLQATSKWDFKSRHLYEDGDGTIIYQSAYPPPVYRDIFKSQIVFSSAEHTELYVDEMVQAKVQSFLKTLGY